MSFGQVSGSLTADQQTDVVIKSQLIWILQDLKIQTKSKKQIAKPQNGFTVDTNLEIDTYHQHSYYNSSTLLSAIYSQKELEHTLKNGSNITPENAKKGKAVHEIIEDMIRQNLSADNLINSLSKYKSEEAKYPMNSIKGVEAGIAFYEKELNAFVFGDCIKEAELKGANLEKLSGKKQLLLILREHAPNVVSADLITTLKGVIGELQRLPERLKLAKKCFTEVSIFDHQQQLRIRPDLVGFSENLGINIHISIKSTASIRQFKYQMRSTSYWVQAAMYRRQLERCFGREFLHLYWVLETSPPYNSRLIAVPDMYLSDYYEQVENLTSEVVKCIRTGEYKGYEKGGVTPYGIEIYEG